MAASRRSRWFPTTTRWTEDDARVALDAWKRSGVGAHAFAREHGITAQRLYWWRDRLAVRPLVSLVPGKIVDVVDRRDDGDGARVTVRVDSVAGTTITISGATASWIAGFVRELARPT